MRFAPLLLVLAACGPADRPSGRGPDAGPRIDAGTSTTTCQLPLPSHGMIIDRGTGGDHLLELARGDTKVALARYYVEWGVGESQIFRNGGMSVERAGALVCSTDPAKTAYENSHHNWRDSAELTHDGVRYRLELSYQFDGQTSWTYQLFGFDAVTGDDLFGPQDLDLVSGPMWP